VRWYVNRVIELHEMAFQATKSFLGWFVIDLLELNDAKSFIFRTGVVWLFVLTHWVANSNTAHRPVKVQQMKQTVKVVSISQSIGRYFYLIFRSALHCNFRNETPKKCEMKMSTLRNEIPLIIWTPRAQALFHHQIDSSCCGYFSISYVYGTPNVT